MDFNAVAKGGVDILKDASPVGDPINGSVASHAIGVGRVLLVGIGDALEDVINLRAQDVRQGVRKEGPERKDDSQPNGLVVQALNV